MADAIAIVDAAMRDLSSGRVNSPQRTVMSVNPATRLGLMPGAMADLGRFGLKVVSLSSDAPKYGLPSHQGLMLLFDDATGRPLAALDTHALTRLRTAAASAVATRALARANAGTLAIVGCGDLAAPHIEAISAVRSIRRVVLWSRTRENAQKLAEARRPFRTQECTIAGSVEEAVGQADIVCTLTASPTPVLLGAWLKPGQHINLVGSSLRAPREADDEVVARGTFIADQREHALSQAGEFCHAVEDGNVTQDHLKGEIGEVLLGRVPGRSNEAEITIYKSLGHVAQDISVAEAALSRAYKSDKVVSVDW
jgi:ornithine cyclodeaminase/alanine dehydrogenase-like protein (mu-crystallin family)